MGEVYAMLYHTALHLLVLSLFYSTAAPPYCLHTILVGEAPTVMFSLLSCPVRISNSRKLIAFACYLPCLSLQSSPSLGKWVNAGDVSSIPLLL